MMVRSLCCSFIAACVVALSACDAKSEKPPLIGGPFYFESIEAKRHMPYLPSQRISEAEALSPSRTATYYQATFSDDGTLARLVAMQQRQTLWQQEVEKKARRVVMTWPDGEKKTFELQ